MERPKPNEYAPYYETYIKKLVGNDIIKILSDQLERTTNLFKSISEEKGNFAYAESKWSIKEMLGHMIDTERVFSYRALCIARGEQQPLPGFEQDDYVKAAHFNKSTLSGLADGYQLVRRSNIALFKSFDEESIGRWGTASNNKVTVRAIMFIIAGHEEHHINILNTKYLND
jgi:uncharacterized damage-inducible protein DinB